MTPSFQCRGHRFNSWLEKFHMLWGVAKKKKRTREFCSFAGWGLQHQPEGILSTYTGPLLFGRLKDMALGARALGGLLGSRDPCRCPAAVRTWSSLEGTECQGC